MKLCFATNNKGKLSEVQEMLGNNFRILSLQDIGCTEELPETEKTIEGNSHQKASYVFNKYKINCFADDTGLEVDALNGAPGVLSARFAGPDCSPEDNMALLLQKLEGSPNRKANFRTVITLIIDGSVHTFEGKINGTILKEKKGLKGFGYDPVFLPNGFEKSFAEFTVGEKNAISHRGQAVKKMVEYLITIK